MIRLNELQTIGCQICPDVTEKSAVLERTLRSALESYKFQLRTMKALFRFSGNSGQIPLELWPSWQQERGESFLCHLVPSVPEAQKRNLLSDPIFQQEDLFAPATLDAARHAARDVSLYKGSQSRPSTSSEMTQWRPFSSSSASRGRTQSSSAPAPAIMQFLTEVDFLDKI